MIRPNTEGASVIGDSIGPPTRVAHQRAVFCVLAYSAISVLSLLQHAGSWWSGRSNPRSWSYDLDTALIHSGLLNAPHLSDTLKWWTGSWVGQVPFYRPITSYLFWIEWKTCGDREWLYVVPGFAAHIAATALIGILVFRVARGRGLPAPFWAGAVAAWGFSGLLLGYRSDVVGEVVRLWKNQPDSFAAVCCFGALLCYHSAQIAGRRRAGAAAVLYLLACGFKEIAVPLPLVCLFMEQRQDLISGRRPGAWRLAWMLTAAIAFLITRSLALGSVGYTYGSNREWFIRTVQEVLGPFADAFTSPEWLGTAVGFTGFAASAIVLRVVTRRPERAIQTVAAACLVVIFTWMLLGWLRMLGEDSVRSQLLSPLGPFVGLMRCLQPVPLSSALATFSMTAAIALMWKEKKILVIGLVWTIAFLTPLILSPGPIHRYYIPQAGYYLVYGCAAAAAIPFFSESINMARSRIRSQQALERS